MKYWNLRNIKKINNQYLNIECKIKKAKFLRTLKLSKKIKYTENYLEIHILK